MGALDERAPCLLGWDDIGWYGWVVRWDGLLWTRKSGFMDGGKDGSTSKLLEGKKENEKQGVVFWSCI